MKFFSLEDYITVQFEGLWRGMKTGEYSVILIYLSPNGIISQLVLHVVDFQDGKKHAHKPQITEHSRTGMFTTIAVSCRRFVGLISSQLNTLQL
jgi:hypothetical protein